MSFRTGLLPAVDVLRAIPGLLGLRQFTVTVRARAWSGTRPGDGGTATNTDTVLRVNGQNPKVAQVSSRDVVASGGLYTSEDFKIGPLTPSLTSITSIDPDPDSSAREVFFKLEGPGMGSSGRWFRRVSDESAANFSYFIIVRSIGTATP
jgi:hypothetical protein